MTFRLRCLALTLVAASAGGPLSAPAAEIAHDAGFARAAQKAIGSGVDVRFRVQGTPLVGRPTQVEIVFGQVSDPAGATVRFSVDPGLRLDSSAGPLALRQGEETRLSVSVVPLVPGLAYLNVITVQRGVASPTSVPVQTGEPEGPANGKATSGRLKDSPDGGKIISIPVK